MRSDLRSVRRSAVTILMALLMAATAVVATGTRAGAAQGCTVQWAEANFRFGFVAWLTLTNLGDPWTSWEMRFAFGGDERLVQGNSASWSQDGPNITVRNFSYNGQVGTGKSVLIGGQFSYSGTHVIPALFNINGVSCTGQVS